MQQDKAMQPMYAEIKMPRLSSVIMYCTAVPFLPRPAGCPGPWHAAGRCGSTDGGRGADAHAHAPLRRQRWPSTAGVGGYVWKSVNVTKEVRAGGGMHSDAPLWRPSAAGIGPEVWECVNIRACSSADQCEGGRQRGGEEGGEVMHLHTPLRLHARPTAAGVGTEVWECVEHEEDVPDGQCAFP